MNDKKTMGALGTSLLMMALSVVPAAALAPSTGALRPSTPDQGVSVAAEDQGPCGDQPCAPPDVPVEGPGPCGDQPCAAPDAPVEGLGPCGEQPCLPPDAAAKGPGPCWDEPCEAPDAAVEGAGPCGDEPCAAPDAAVEGPGPCGDEPCPPSVPDTGAAAGVNANDSGTDTSDATMFSAVAVVGAALLILVGRKWRLSRTPVEDVDAK